MEGAERGLFRPVARSFSGTFALRRLGVKRPKTDLQALVMRHFYPEFCAAEQRVALVEHIRGLTGLTERQVNKWMWDEELRRKQLSEEERTRLDVESTEAFTVLMRFFERDCPLQKTYVMDTLYLPLGRRGLPRTAALAATRLQPLAKETLLFIKE